MSAPPHPLPGTLTGSIIDDPDIAAAYGVDSSPGATPPERFTVVRARHRDDVIEVLRYAARHLIPVVPQGGRTGLVGGAVAINDGIVLSTAYLADCAIDPDQRIAICGPGVVLDDLKRAAGQVGLAYPPDPSSAASCTIGGTIATNAGGLCCVKYGVTADYVLGLEVVLPGGEVIRTGRRTAKGVTGMDLTGIMVGSEGGLGVVTEAVVRLIPAADTPLTVLGVFADVDAAMTAVARLRSERHTPNLIEFLDGPGIAAIQAYRDVGFPTDAGALLLVQSDRAEHTGPDARRYATVLAQAGAEVAIADDAGESDLLMAGRRSLNPAMEAKGHRMIEDLCVPVAKLGELVAEAHRIGRETGLEITCSGHAGDGNLHPAIFYDATDPDQSALAAAAFDALIREAWRLGGTLSGEHGIGTAKQPWLAGELGAAEVARQRAIKAVFDPLGIMNPGRVYPA